MSLLLLFLSSFLVCCLPPPRQLLGLTESLDVWGTFSFGIHALVVGLYLVCQLIPAKKVLYSSHWLQHTVISPYAYIGVMFSPCIGEHVRACFQCFFLGGEGVSCGKDVSNINCSRGV